MVTSSAQTACVVVGAGPAGASAALWLRKLGVAHLVVDAGAEVGGQLARVNLPIRDLLGVSIDSGRAYLQRIAADLAAAGVTVRRDCRVLAIHPAERRLETSLGLLQARALILATGVRRRRLQLPGIDALWGHGLSDSATGDLERIAGQAAAVCGGGDGAFENALILAERCPHVYLVHRGTTPRARAEFVTRVTRHPRISVVAESEVVALHAGQRGLQSVEIAGPGGRRSLRVPWLVVKIGYLPNLEALADDSLARDGDGYLVVDRSLRCSVAGVFAAGDVCNPRSPCLAAALGDGAVAAAQVKEYLESAPAQRGTLG